MKSISIVYSAGDNQLATTINKALQSLYSITLCPLSEEKSASYYYDIWNNKNMPNLILTLNEAGFSLKTIGQDLAYTKLPINIFHVFTQPIAPAISILQGFVPFTTKVITTNPEDYEKIVAECTHLYEPVCAENLTDTLQQELEHLDWRMN